MREASQAEAGLLFEGLEALNLEQTFTSTVLEQGLKGHGITTYKKPCCQKGFKHRAHGTVSANLWDLPPLQNCSIGKGRLERGKRGLLS